MSGSRVERALAGHFRVNAGRYGLSADNLVVAPKLNWGGFVNLHFEVGDGARSYHVKLSAEPDVRAGLEQWRSVAPILETRYRAPKVVDWVNLEDLALSGLVLERAGGGPLELHSAVVFDVLRLLEELHADDELEGILRARGVEATARSSVLGHYVRHLEADLEESGDRYPVEPFVVDWMRRELDVLREIIARAPSFDAVRPVPIHGDLWKDNLVVEVGEGPSWYVLDWDDLSLGDPVIDYATLLWPLVRDGAEASRWLAGRAEDASFMARFQLCLRAAHLDEVIDPLADWVEAEKMPEHAQRVREVKKRVHERAYGAYRRRYDR